MTKAQKRIVVNWLWVVLLLIVFTIFDDWILSHRDALKWPVLVGALIIGVIGSSKSEYSRAQGHVELNRIIEENPWIKIFYVVYGIAIAIVDYYAISNNIDLIEKINFFEFAGAILLLFLPMIVIKQKEAWKEAGEED